MDTNDAAAFVANELAVQGGAIAKPEILLVIFLVDDSGSIAECGNTQAVIDGFNGFLEVLRHKPSGKVLFRKIFLNATSGDDFEDLHKIPLLSGETYRPRDGTPLYARAVDSLQIILAEARRLTEQGAVVRTMTFIFTDGTDNASHGIKAENVKMITDVMWTTGTHIIAGCAVNDGCTNFWQVFASMGIPERWIKVLKNDGQEIKSSFRAASDSVIFASESAESFTQSSVTGFAS